VKSKSILIYFLIIISIPVFSIPKIYTVKGIPELDKSAAAWIMQKFKFPNAEVVFADKTNMPKNAVSFDFPGALIERPGNKTAFESVIRYYGIKDKVLNKMIPILRDIEINKWGQKKTAEATGVIVIHNGFVFSGQNEQQVMKSDWIIIESLYNYFKKTGEGN